MASHCLRSIPILGSDRPCLWGVQPAKPWSRGTPEWMQQVRSNTFFLLFLQVVGNLVLPCDFVGTGDKFGYEDAARIEDLTAHR